MLDKPAGMVVHPAPGHAGGTLVNALLAHCGAQPARASAACCGRASSIASTRRSAALMVVGQGRPRPCRASPASSACTGSSACYEAIVWGVPAPPAGTIDRPIGRHPRDRKRMAVVARRQAGADPLAAARRRRARSARGCEFELATGRTHQIRVHLGSARPSASSAIRSTGRGAGRRAGPALRASRRASGGSLLHARMLGFEHPVSGARAALRARRRRRLSTGCSNCCAQAA